jgi:hypothetical protein
MRLNKSMKVVLVLARQSRQVGASGRGSAQPRNGSAAVAHKAVALRDTAHSAVRVLLLMRRSIRCPGQDLKERREIHRLRREVRRFCQLYSEQEAGFAMLNSLWILVLVMVMNSDWLETQDRNAALND